MTETSMWKPGLTCHWRPLCRRDRTQFHRGDRVAAVVWVVLDNRMSVSYGHPSRTTGPTETTIWQPGFIQKTVETARDDYMQTMQVYFLHMAQQGDFTD